MVTITPAHVKEALLAANITSWVADDNPVAVLSPGAQKHLLGSIPSAEVARLWKRLRIAAPVAPIPAYATSVDWRYGHSDHRIAVEDCAGYASCVSFACLALAEATGQLEATVWLDSAAHNSSFCVRQDENQAGKSAAVSSEHMLSRRSINPDDAPDGCVFAPDSERVSGANRCLTARDQPERVVKLASRPLLASPTAVKNYMTGTGPVVGCLTVYDDLFSYKSGVYRHLTGNVAGGHCVLIVGYSEAQQCWIIKNSWGPEWGMGGYAKIAYTDFVFDGRFGPMYGAAGSTSHEEMASARWPRQRRSRADIRDSGCGTQERRDEPAGPR